MSLAVPLENRPLLRSNGAYKISRARRLPLLLCGAFVVLLLLCSQVGSGLASGTAADGDCPVDAGEECADNEKKQADAKKLAKEAENFYMKKKYREAIATYGKAIKVWPHDEKLYYKRARSWNKIGSHRSELKDLNKVLTMNPEYLSAIAFRARAHMSLGDCKAAVSDYERTLAIKPKHGDANKLLPRAKECVSKIGQADRLIKQGRSDQAENILTSIIDLVGRAPSLTLMRAKARYMLGRFFETIADCGEVVKKESDNVEALLLRGRSYYQVGDHEMATRHYKEALSHDPDHTESKAAFKQLQKITKLTKLGQKSLKTATKDSWQAALDAFQEAIGLDPHHGVHNKVLLVEVCKIHIKWGEVELATKACEGAIAIDSGVLEPYVLLATLLTNRAEETPEFEEAVRAWQRAADVDNGDQRVQEGMRKAEVGLKQSKQKNYYKTLSVPRRAETGEIKKAYRKLAKEYHPDRHGDKSDEEKAALQAKFEAVAEAYEVLSSDELRAKYDRGEDVFENQGNNNQRGGGFHHPFGRGGGGFNFNFGGGGRRRH